MAVRKQSTDKWWRTEGVAGEFFRTKAELEARIRGIVAKYPHEADMEPKDVAFLSAVLSRHYDWAAKSGAGVAGYCTRAFTAWSGTSTGLVLKRVDGSEVDISWVVALMPGGATSAVLNAMSAARYEVVDQRNEASASVALGAPCPICGNPLMTDRHVDHKPPKTFKALFLDWLDAIGMTPDQIEVEDVGVADSRFVSRGLALQWARFHRHHAELRVIHKHENLARAA